MPAVTVALLLLAHCGHTALWVGLINRVHSIGMPRPLVKALSAPCPTMFALLPLAALVFWWRSGIPLAEWLDQARQNWVVLCYLLTCWTIALITVGLWTIRHAFHLDRAVVREKHTKVIDVSAQLGRKPVSGSFARLMSLVPGNQALQIAVEEVQLELPRLPPSLDGFSIALLSDFHITGHLGIEFYQAAIEQACGLHADIVAVCGDIVDDVEFLTWLPDTLGRLSAPHGAFFVLGNHDMFTGEVPHVRQALTDVGLINLGARWQTLNIDGTEVIVAGNELPWLKPAAPMQTCPPRSADRPQLRVLLSHSPDQLPWARRWDFDLVMAGHTHGGQFRLPLIGPIACPSWHGVKYAAGAYFSRPTAMYVSRGLAAENPLRLNCRPEVTKLVLRCLGAKPAK